MTERRDPLRYSRPTPLQFHATHVSVIEAEPGYTGTCLNSAIADRIFQSGFQ